MWQRIQARRYLFIGASLLGLVALIALSAAALSADDPDEKVATRESVASERLGPSSPSVQQSTRRAEDDLAAVEQTLDQLAIALRDDNAEAVCAVLTVEERARQGGGRCAETVRNSNLSERGPRPGVSVGNGMITEALITLRNPPAAALIHLEKVDDGEWQVSDIQELLGPSDRT
jgi:hypothetical protein